jgi:hypothetical protein
LLQTADFKKNYIVFLKSVSEYSFSGLKRWFIMSVVYNFGVNQNSSITSKSDSFAVKAKKVIVDHKVAIVAGIALIGLGMWLASVPFRYYKCEYSSTFIQDGREVGNGMYMRTGRLSLFQYLYFLWKPDSVECLVPIKLSSTFL